MSERILRCAPGLLLSIAAGCAPGPAPPTSLLGAPLTPMPLADDVRADRAAKLEEAIIWYGRRLAYLGEYDEAIAVYTDGLRRFPDSYRLLRHRGHRFITLRRIDEAIADLSRAAALAANAPDEVEPDGLPNRRNQPTSTSHTNIFYHLGLAHYVKSEYEDALVACGRCLSFAKNDDMRCATRYWMYLTQRRLGNDAAAATVLAPVTADMDIIENTSYHQLLLLYKGMLTPEEVAGGDSAVGAAIDDATMAYGIAMWHELRGDHAEARRRFERIVAGDAWPAFGHLAAEAELARAE